MKAMLLAAGLGTRLRPLTEVWPKCLMPIRGKPLLEYWLLRLKSLEINEVLVNLHHQHVVVEEFLNREMFSGWVKYSHEDSLFGTAGTLRKNYDFLRGDRVMLIHADNWSCCNYYDVV